MRAPTAGVAGMVAVALAACMGCARHGAGTGSRPQDAGGTTRVDGTASPQARALDAAAAPSDVPPEPPPPPPFSPPATGEARRATLRSFEREPLLRPYVKVLREHFETGDAGARRGPYAMQRTELAGGRTAVLLCRLDDSNPIVLVLDRDAIVWSKPRPVAGITPPFRHLALTPRPDGGVALFGYVEALHLVAARMWADDSYPYADIELFSADACDALRASYDIGRGWTVTCTSRNGTRTTSRLREDLTTAAVP